MIRWTHANIRSSSIALVVAALLALLAACGSSDPAGPAADGTPQVGSAATYPMTITTPYGTTTLEKAPERVVVIGPEDVDAVLALGIVPVAAAGWGAYDDPEGNWAPYYGDTTVIKKTLTPVAGGADPEEILSLKPDVIIASGGIEDLAKGYDSLAKIAPVVTFPEKLESWASGDPITTLRTIARPLNKVAEGEALIQKYEDELASARAAHPEFDGKTITLASIGDGTGLHVWTQPDSAAEKFLDSLGFKPNPKTAEATGTLPEEKYELVDADVLVTLTDRDSDEESIAKLRKNPLYNELKVVRNGAVVHLDDSPNGVFAASPLTTPSVPSMIWMVENVPDLLAPAAKAADAARTGG